MSPSGPGPAGYVSTIDFAYPICSTTYMTTITTDSVELKKIIYDTVSILLDEKLKNIVTKKDLFYLPTKVQFYAKMDE